MVTYLLHDWENLSEKKKAYKYPNVAGELLSAMNDKVVAYFSQGWPTGDMANFDKLLGFFEQHQTPEALAQLNYTRAGYLCKALSAMVLEKSGVFPNYLFNRRAAVLPTLIRCCQSKSVAGLVFSLLTLLPTAQQQPYQLGIPMVPEYKPDHGQLQSEVMKETFERRLDLFRQVIDVCVETQNDPALTELHANLANVIMIIINKDFPEQGSFMNVLYEKLPAVVDSFCSTFHSFANNKLGNIYLVLLEILLKESAQKHSLPAVDPAFLVGITERYFRLISDYFRSPAHDSREQMLTPSFSREIKRLNPKIYKVMEALIVTMRTLANAEAFDDAAIARSDFERSIFRFFEAYPFNNILHNQLKKFLLILVEKASPAVLHKFFSQNQEFFGFLERLTRNKFVEPPGRKRVKIGFVGHVVTIATAIIDKGGPLLEGLSQSEVTRPGLEPFFNGLLRPRVPAGVPGPGRHRVPHGPGRVERLPLRLHHRGDQATARHLPELPGGGRGHHPH